mmetsp:Transcript_20246/g.59695  ORF Transcript_20246/g.59695 Transcript_20246/m.59695 type:complete len:96 (+) Transcript_20246:857-1144(+)
MVWARIVPLRRMMPSTARTPASIRCSVGEYIPGNLVGRSRAAEFEVCDETLHLDDDVACLRAECGRPSVIVLAAAKDVPRKRLNDCMIITGRRAI